MNADVLNRLTDFIALLIVVTFFGSAASVVYIARVYRGSARTSQVFRMLVRADALKVVATAWLGGLSVLRLLILPQGSTFPTWTTPISAIAIEILLIPPIYHALTIAKLRRERGNATPPPFTPED